MIVNYEYLNSKLIVSYIDKKGNMKFKNYDWRNPLEWRVCSATDLSRSDTFVTWDKKPVKLESTRHPSRYAIYEFFHKLPQSEKDDIFAYNEPKMFFCDIEVEITEGFPEAHLANNKVTAICFIHGSKILLLGIKELGSGWVQKMERDINDHFKEFNMNYTIEWSFFETEKEMLYYVFNDLIPHMPVITGWNFVGYDWVYLVTRARKLNINPDVASPTGKLIKPWKKNSDDFKPTFEELPLHRLVFDYMDIFGKWDTSIKIKEAETLDFTSSKVLGVKKLEYKGTLKDLYDQDYYKYMLYNCVDTALVQLIHNKQHTFDMMLSQSNLANIEISQTLSALRITEGILFYDFYDNGIILCRQKTSYSSQEDEIEDDDILSGGYVKYPTIGLLRWISVFDFASLYPTTMRQFNIAPESFKGIKISDTESLLNGVKFKLEDDDIILLNGAVFKNEESITKRKLTDIFKGRKTNKNLGLDYKKQEQLMKKYLENRKTK